MPEPRSDGVGPKRTVIFWNCARLFGSGGSPIEHALTLDDPDSRANATQVNRKIEIMGAFIDAIAAESGAPVVIGLVEVESSELASQIARAVSSVRLNDIDSLADDETGLSLDGLNISLLVDTDYFPGPYRLRSHLIDRAFGTRDVLEADLSVSQREPPLSVFVHHWPSRLSSEGHALRQAAAQYGGRLVNERVRYTLREMWDADESRLDLPTQDEALVRARAPVVVMGDFNDEVFDSSLQIMGATPDTETVLDDLKLRGRSNQDRFVSYRESTPYLLNPFWSFVNSGGSYYRSPRWRTYDQILMSRGVVEPEHAWPLRYLPGSATIFDAQTVSLPDGSSINVTNRGGKPIPYEPKKDRGCSDHFPVVASFAPTRDDSR